MAGACAALAVALLLLAGPSAPAMLGAPVKILASADKLRQIEVFVAPGILGRETTFYLYDAGFRARKKRHLLATLYGDTRWSLRWAGPQIAILEFGSGPARLVTPSGAGVEIKARQALLF